MKFGKIGAWTQTRISRTMIRIQIDFDDKEEAIETLRASEYRNALADILQHFRALEKHGPEKINVEEAYRYICLASDGLDVF